MQSQENGNLLILVTLILQSLHLHSVVWFSRGPKHSHDYAYDTDWVARDISLTGNFYMSKIYKKKKTMPK